MSDEIEQMIAEKGLTAPRVTPEQIEAQIVSEYAFTAADAVRYHTPPLEDLGPLHRLIFVVLVLRNGFTVTGESACVSPENFDAAIGIKIARKHAVDKIWELEGYLLTEDQYRKGYDSVE